MLNKLALSFATFGLAVSFAASNTYKVEILDNTTISGKQVKAGSYKIEVENNVATLKHGKDSIQVPAREETAQTKYSDTRMQFSDNSLREIHIGGTNTKIVFVNDSASASASSN